MLDLSIEVFPPKTEEGFSNLQSLCSYASSIGVKWVSVTYGANGGNRDNALRVASELQKILPVVSHVTCTNSSKETVDTLLKDVSSLGVSSILALRGDPIPGSIEPSYYSHVTDLLEDSSIKDLGFTVGVACYPEIFRSESSLAKEIEFLKKKQDLGAKFAITQLFFDNKFYFAFVRAARRAGVTIPIIPGISIVTSLSSLYKMARMCGASVPSSLFESVQAFEGNDEAVTEVGLNYAANQITELIASGVPGIHIFTMNKKENLSRLYERIKTIILEVNK